MAGGEHSMRTVLEDGTLGRLRTTRLALCPEKKPWRRGKSKVMGRGSIKLQGEKLQENKKGKNKYLPIIQMFTGM